MSEPLNVHMVISNPVEMTEINGTELGRSMARSVISLGLSFAQVAACQTAFQTEVSKRLDEPIDIDNLGGLSAKTPPDCSCGMCVCEHPSVTDIDNPVDTPVSPFWRGPLVTAPVVLQPGAYMPELIKIASTDLAATPSQFETGDIVLCRDGWTHDSDLISGFEYEVESTRYYLGEDSLSLKGVPGWWSSKRFTFVRRGS